MSDEADFSDKRKGVLNVLRNFCLLVSDYQNDRQECEAPPFLCSVERTTRAQSKARIGSAPILVNTLKIC
jgi:hypothetical protein